jgi:Protein of unknown function (DUF2934)
MDGQVRKCRCNRVTTVESRNDQHQEIILATTAKRTYQLFERRGCAHGFALEDWTNAEKELLQNDFKGNSSEFDFFIKPGRDPGLTTILSVATHSIIVFRSDARHNTVIDRSAVVSVHVFPEGRN